ncbi:mandelate racemase/muconate lactonizing enzyme family protein [Acidimicrobiaceae bacterium USS-CC1]|uniref:Mandelate racemase/muconate lactonizing enzyme family protein n=1 Tax=Acidiferrimicrobium australe TaxID=2664430 RepID=A0ABW9QNU3_9ACTN|nr:mandelate racemase/muconate lactonizing enzyme family protein [Acidiferrimicrobium australe]
MTIQPWAATSGGGARIVRVDTVPVRAPLAREFRGSYYRMSNRATLVVQVHTDAGVTGEVYVGDEDETLLTIESIVQREIAPRLIDRDVLATERCWEAAHPVTFDILRDRRLGLVALAGVDAAIWDAVGKILDQPLWRLWGGYRRSVPMVAIGGYYGEPLGPLAEEVAHYRELGLAGMKLKVGGASPEEDARRVSVAREAGGADFVLTLDANQGYSARDALELCRRVDGLGVRWFEEPVRWENDRRGLRDIRLMTALPVCAGQSEHSAAGCRDLMEAGAIDVCNFDSSWSGGPTAWRRVAALAHTYGVEMGHHEEPHVAAHLLASQPHGTYVECFHPDRDPFWWNLVTNRPPLEGGFLTLSDRPGFGWDLDWDYIGHHRVRS